VYVFKVIYTKRAIHKLFEASSSSRPENCIPTHDETHAYNYCHETMMTHMMMTQEETLQENIGGLEL
jgi:hypothetical protein